MSSWLGSKKLEPIQRHATIATCRPRVRIDSSIRELRLLELIFESLYAIFVSTVSCYTFLWMSNLIMRARQVISGRDPPLMIDVICDKVIAPLLEYIISTMRSSTSDSSTIESAKPYIYCHIFAWPYSVASSNSFVSISFFFLKS